MAHRPVFFLGKYKMTRGHLCLVLINTLCLGKLKHLKLHHLGKVVLTDSSQVLLQLFLRRMVRDDKLPAKFLLGNGTCCKAQRRGRETKQGSQSRLPTHVVAIDLSPSPDCAHCYQQRWRQICVVLRKEQENWGCLSVFAMQIVFADFSTVVRVIS